jgi:hypothetical protein
MAHAPEHVTRYVCENCQVLHAGTPIHRTAAEHDFEPPAACGGCGESSFVRMQEWVHHHE